MPDPHPDSTTALARPVLREADYAARERRLTQRKAAEHLRARLRWAKAGDVELRAWVPAAHADRIRDLVAGWRRLFRADSAFPWSWTGRWRRPPDADPARRSG